jgi:hypothetical protein
MQGYAATTTFGITLASLAALSAREGLLYDNTTDKYDDYQVEIGLEVLTPTTADSQGCYIYFAGDVNGTNFQSPCTGTDAAVTLGTHSLPSVFMPVPVGTQLRYHVIGSVALMFGGILPDRCAIVVENRTNGALWSTEATFVKNVRGVFFTT